MWSCPNCREVVEDQFDACWRCGCSREGRLNLDFVAEPSNEPGDSSIEEHFRQNYVCQRCKRRDARIERISTTGTGLAKLVKRDFLAVSCENCGLTELYNLSVLEGRSDLQNFLRGVFGM
jgi:predicted nucleic-acid-binding Zn-ribbon protein